MTEIKYRITSKMMTDYYRMMEFIRQIRDDNVFYYAEHAEKLLHDIEQQEMVKN